MDQDNLENLSDEQLLGVIRDLTTENRNLRREIRQKIKQRKIDEKSRKLSERNMHLMAIIRRWLETDTEPTREERSELQQYYMPSLQGMSRDQMIKHCWEQDIMIALLALIGTETAHRTKQLHDILERSRT